MLRRFTSRVGPKGQITRPLVFHRQRGTETKETASIDLKGYEVRAAPAAFTLESARLRASAAAVDVGRGDGPDRAGGARRVGDRRDGGGVRFVDTNNFVRYLNRDDPVKPPTCCAFFQRAQVGEQEVHRT